MVLKKFVAGRGYSKADWDAVESPDLIDAQLAQPLTFEEAFPGQVRPRGRPKLASPKAAVTLRLDPSTIARFEASGPDWRRKMAEIIERAKP